METSSHPQHITGSTQKILPVPDRNIFSFYSLFYMFLEGIAFQHSWLLRESTVKNFKLNRMPWNNY